MKIHNKTLSTVDEGLKFIVLAELTLWAFLYLFIFIIKWKDWIFAIRIAGFSAGLHILARFLAAGGITCLIIRYPGHGFLQHCRFFSSSISFSIQRCANGYYPVEKTPSRSR